MKAYWLGGRSSPANGASTAGAVAADGHNADNSDGGGVAAKSHGGHHRSSRRSGRKQVDRTISSNRSSPEQSPERLRKLNPLSTLSSATTILSSPSIHVNGTIDESTSHGHKGLHGHHGHSLSKKRTLSPHPPVTRPRTGTSTSMHYLGSNESESSLRTDSDGDASSSEDSATDMLDAALGLSRVASNIDQQHSDFDASAPMLASGRREMLVQRPIVESTNLVTSFENAMRSMRPSFSAGSGQPRARSATPGPVAPTPSMKIFNGIPDSASGQQGLSPPVDHKVFNLASRRRGSPLQSDGKHSDETRSISRPPTLKRSSTPVISSHVAKKSKWRLHFRVDILPEVTILTVSLIIAAYRLSHLPEALGKRYEPIPISPVVMLIFLVPALALFRQRGVQSNFLFPFTDERGYRSPASVDDGFAAGTVVPVLLAAGFLWDAVVSGPDKYKTLSDIRPLMDVWQARGYVPLNNSIFTHAEIFATVLKARVSLLLTTSTNSFILILHIILSKTVLPIDRIPMNNTKRLALATLLSASVSAALWGLLALNNAFAWATSYVSPLEAAVSSFIYQMSMYSISRLVRRGFTLGELSLATGAGISLGLEFWRITYVRFFYRKYGGIAPTYRMPTPLLPYHHVMIPGAFLTGFCLAPLLVLSRHFAQMPSHRLKQPGSRTRNRTLVALGIFAFLVIIVMIPFGGWAGWALGGRFATAWTWGLTFLFFGGDGVSYGSEQKQSTMWRYRRIGLSLYWLAIMTTAVGGWQTRLVRARRIRLAKGRHLASAQNSSASSAENGPTISKANLEVVGVSNIRENRRMHVALDLRRKFFHALAVLMFVPAIAIDPAFTSLAFAAAFAIFTFAEYARYFAVYPIGAPIHVFFNEFIDSKDAGPVILSHFYLLTGCAGGLWLEGDGIKQFTGVLAVGIGDACASVLGKRIGVLRWPGSSKTLFGTSAFITSIFASSLLLRSVGMVEPFPASRYLLVTVMAGLLEAMSAQNDNLVIPIFFWSMLSLFEV